MKIANRIVSNTLNMFSIDILSDIIGMSFMIYAARVLGVKEFGIFILIGTVVNLVNMFSNAGIRPMAIREIAKNKDNAGAYINNILGLSLIMTFIAYIVMSIFVYFVDYELRVKTLLLIMGLYMFSDAFVTTFAIIYIAFEKMKVFRQISILTALLSSCGSILILYLGYGVKALILNGIFFSIFSAVIYGYHVWVRFFPFKIEAKMSILRGMFLESVPFALHGILSMITQRSSVFLLSVIRGPVDPAVAIGYYAPANRALTPVMKLPQSMRIALLPVISGNENSPELIKKIVEKTTKYLLIFLSFPIVFITTFFPEQLISFVLGRQYLPTAAILSILGWAFAFKALNAPIISVLASSKHLYRHLYLSAGIAIFTIGLNIILIPVYSYKGAAITVLAEAIISTLTRHYLVRDIYGRNPEEEKMLVKVISAIVTSIVLTFILNNIVHLPLLFSVLIGLAVYGGMIFSMGVFTLKEIAVAVQSFLKNTPVRV